MLQHARRLGLSLSSYNEKCTHGCDCHIRTCALTTNCIDPERTKRAQDDRAGYDEADVLPNMGRWVGLGCRTPESGVFALSVL